MDTSFESLAESLVKNERHHPGPTCNYLASNRKKYCDVPFRELIALAVRARLADIQDLDSENVKRLAEIASKKQYREKGDFAKVFFKWCKSLKPEQQVAALYGNVTPWDLSSKH